MPKATRVDTTPRTRASDDDLEVDGRARRKAANPVPESTDAPAAGPVSGIGPVPATHGAPAAAARPAGFAPVLSRRSVVALMAAGVMPAAPASTSGLADLVQAPPVGEHTDARLLELGARYQHVCSLEAAADEAYERACESVQEVERPEVLRHRLEDHVELELPFDQANAKGGFSAEPSLNPFYTSDEIRRLRTAPPLEEAARRAEQRTRIEEIERAWKAHVDAFHAAEEAAGVNAALEAIDEVAVMKRTVAKEIAAAPATTLVGLRVRAKIIADLVEDTGDDHCTDDLMVASIVRDILSMRA